jgi:hypothetical protein
VFIGHFAVALGAKRPAPKVALGWLFLSCQLADLIWPVLGLWVDRHRAAEPLRHRSGGA